MRVLALKAKGLRRFRSERGFSLLELMVVFSLMGVISAVGVYSLRELNDPLKDSAAQMLTNFKRARAKALATTFAYTVTPSADGSRVVASYADNCSDSSPTIDTSLEHTLPDGVSIMDRTWSLCFTARGTLSDSQDIVISDGIKEMTLQIAMGGGMRLI